MLSFCGNSIKCLVQANVSNWCIDYTGIGWGEVRGCRRREVGLLMADIAEFFALMGLGGKGVKGKGHLVALETVAACHLALGSGLGGRGWRLACHCMEGWGRARACG